MKEIILTRGKVAIVDDGDYEMLMQWKWLVQNGTGNSKDHWYARRVDTSGGGRKLISMHRLIMGITDKSLVVDHINHNTLDNRKENLRVCTPEQNRKNRRSSTGSTSKYLGVSKQISKRGDKVYTWWKAEIRPTGGYMYLGIFKNEEDAARKYNEAALELYGEFANLNIIP